MWKSKGQIAYLPAGRQVFLTVAYFYEHFLIKTTMGEIRK